MSLLARYKQALTAIMGRTEQKRALSSVDDSRGWRVLYDYGTSMTAWQKDLTIDNDQVLANWAVWSCTTLIAGDIGKVSLRVMDKVGSVWEESYVPAFSPVLLNPNGHQNRQQFLERWMYSKLLHGNAYILLRRDQRNVVTSMHVLDPCRVRPLVATDGSVYYELMQDDMAALEEPSWAVPASEIIHDRFNCQYHDLIGLSPITACGLAATHGQKIGINAAKFFENMSRPSGILSAPGAISDATALRLKESWDANYAGSKVGKIAVLGDGLDYKPMTISASDSQLIEQLKFTAEMVCATFHVPSWKIGSGTIPSGQKVGDLTEWYYSDCLHSLMDAIQTLLGKALGFDQTKRAVMFDLDDLIKMDRPSLMAVLKEGVGAAILSPNEARQRLNLPPVPGGEAPLSQQQNWSLEMLSERTAIPDAASVAAPPVAVEEEPEMDVERFLSGLNRKNVAAEVIAGF